MSDVVFFSTWHLLGNRVSKTWFLTPKNLKKFEVSCTGRNTQKQIQEILKTSIPILKTQIKGRERLEGEKDSGRPKPQQPRREPWPGSCAAWGDLGVRAPSLGRARPGFAWVAHGGLKPPTPISDLDLLSLSIFFFLFFLSWVLFWCSSGSSLICPYL